MKQEVLNNILYHLMACDDIELVETKAIEKQKMHRWKALFELLKYMNITEEQAQYLYNENRKKILKTKFNFKEDEELKKHLG